jgi:hypothetical protein
MTGVGLFVVYVGNRHTVTATAKRVLLFHCVHCGGEAQAMVVGVGRGQGNSAYFLDEAGAKERASNGAQEAAEVNAALTLSLAVCPGCGRRDEGRLRAVRMKTIAGAVGAAMLLLVLGLVLDGLDRHGHLGLYIFGPSALFTAWVIWSTQTWKWTTIDNRVVFLSREPS